MSPRRVRISVPRRAAVHAGWILVVLAAAGIGWGVGQLGREPAVPPPSAVVVLERSPVAEELPGPAEETPPVPAPEPRPQPRPAVRKPEPTSDPAPVVVVEPEPAPEPGTPALVRALRASKLAEDGDDGAAKLEAAALLSAHPSYSKLVDAFLHDDPDKVLAWLTALRVLQLAGHETICRDVARELKLSYAGTERVVESIREWRILHPRIVSVESSIAEDRYVVVTGTIENPDVTDIRRIRVRVEALDAAGNALDTTTVRVRPRLLPPGASATFQATFKRLDPTTVLRTRATIVEWESEAPGEG